MLVRLHKLNGSEGDSRGFQQQMLDFLGGCISGIYRLIASVGAVSGSLFPNRNIQDQNPPTHSTRSSWRTWLGFQSISSSSEKRMCPDAVFRWTIPLSRHTDRLEGLVLQQDLLQAEAHAAKLSPRSYSYNIDLLGCGSRPQSQSL